MPARKRPKDGANWHPEQVRARIRATDTDQPAASHIFDGLELSLIQVRAIDILLKKCVPDLTSTTVTADITHPLCRRIAAQCSRARNGNANMATNHLDLKATPLAITNGSGNLQ